MSATGPSGQLSASISSLLGAQRALSFDPQTGGWNEKLPQIGGLGPSTTGGPRAPGGPVMVQNPAYFRCKQQCDEDRNGNGGIFGWPKWTEKQYQDCLAKCPPQLVPQSQAIGQAGNDPLGFCNDCAPLNPGACIGCAWEYAAHAGIEIGLVALVLLGIYLWLK